MSTGHSLFGATRQPAMLPAVQPSDLLPPEDYVRLIRIAHGDDSARALRGDGSFWVARPPITDSTRPKERPAP